MLRWHFFLHLLDITILAVKDVSPDYYGKTSSAGMAKILITRF
jgi:hypothetical protein